jgi:hypothetical protein
MSFVAALLQSHIPQDILTKNAPLCQGDKNKELTLSSYRLPPDA